jgi:hypothetical protein
MTVAVRDSLFIYLFIGCVGIKLSQHIYSIYVWLRWTSSDPAIIRLVPSPCPISPFYPTIAPRRTQRASNPIAHTLFQKKKKNKSQSCNFHPHFCFSSQRELKGGKQPLPKDERTTVERFRSPSQSVTPRKSEALH